MAVGAARLARDGRAPRSPRLRRRLPACHRGRHRGTGAMRPGYRPVRQGGAGVRASRGSPRSRSSRSARNASATSSTGAPANCSRRYASSEEPARPWLCRPAWVAGNCPPEGSPLGNPLFDRNRACGPPGLLSESTALPSANCAAHADMAVQRLVSCPGRAPTDPQDWASRPRPSVTGRGLGGRHAAQDRPVYRTAPLGAFSGLPRPGQPSMKA